MKYRLCKIVRSGFAWFGVILIYIAITANNNKSTLWEPDESDSISIVACLPDSIAALAMELSGIRYQYGGVDKAGFDCSGFTSYVFKKHNIHLPRTSHEQFHIGKKISQNDIKRADLIFFKGRNTNSKYIGHVGRVISDWNKNNIYFVHVTTRGGIRMDSLTNPYYKARYMGTSRVVE